MWLSNSSTRLPFEVGIFAPSSYTSLVLTHVPPADLHPSCVDAHRRCAGVRGPGLSSLVGPLSSRGPDLALRGVEPAAEDERGASGADRGHMPCTA